MGLKENLKSSRENLGLTLEDCANRVGIAKPTLQRYESGKISNIPSDKIEALAKIYNTTPAYLMGWQENKPAENDELKEENLKLFNSLPDDKKQEALRFLRFLQGK